MSHPHQEETPALESTRLLAQADAALKDQENRCFKEFHLNRSQFLCLMALGNTDGLRMGEIARELLVTKGSVTQLIKEMEIKGFVTKARNPSNEREVIVRLTPQGESAFAMAWPKRAEILKEALDRVMNPEEQVQLRTLLLKIRDGLSSKSASARRFA